MFPKVQEIRGKQGQPKDIISSVPGLPITAETGSAKSKQRTGRSKCDVEDTVG